MAYRSDEFYSSELFQRFFKNSANSLILKSNDPDFTILAVSDAFLSVTQQKREHLLGKNVFDVFPGRPETRLERHENLEKTINEKVRVNSPEFSYEAVNSATGVKDLKHWSSYTEPLIDENGVVNHVLATVNDITTQVSASQERQKALETLKAYEQNIINMVRQAPVGMCILQGNPLFVVEANDNFLELIGKTREELSKKPYWEVNAEAAPYYKPITDELLRSGVTYHANEHALMLVRKGKEEIVHVDFVYEPMKNVDGKAYAIMIVAIDITDKVTARLKIEEAEELLRLSNEDLSAVNEELSAANEEMVAANEELAAANGELTDSKQVLQKLLTELAASEDKTRNIIESAPFPIGVYNGRDMRITFANSAMTDVWGKGGGVIGKRYNELLPELDNQEVFAQLDSVFNTGIPFRARNQRIDLIADGILKTSFFNYDFTALTDSAGEIYGVMNTGADVTDIVMAKNSVEEASGRMASLNEELATVNEELAAVNEELAAANEEQKLTNADLVISQRELQVTISHLSQSESRFQNLVRDATVGIIVLAGDEMKVEIVNDAYARLVGRTTNDLLNKPLFSVIPETEGYFRPIIDKVRITGEPLFLYDTPYLVYSEEKKIEGFLNLVYQPYREANGTITGVMVVCQDVTEQVNARKKLEQAEESLRVATESAELGTWYLQETTNEFIISTRFKELFGFKADEDVSFRTAIAQIHPEYQKTVARAAESSLNDGKPFNIEYPVIGFHDQKERWVRSVGKLVNDEKSGNYITGVIVDISEQKRDEQRKNDFIGMVSHELKTPLTSISAYLQMLQLKARKTDDTFTSSALDKSFSQVKKMTRMINGFLNVSRLESGKIHIDRQRFDMAWLIKETEDESVMVYISHNIIFAPVVETFVYADRDKIGQVINNFLSNAVKYSPNGSTIHVACVNDNGKALVSVKDEGMGVSARDTDKLFERFYRTENVTASSISGFGIGLYLCAEIIQRHDGKIWVESEPGNGSTFYFSLPVAV